MKTLYIVRHAKSSWKNPGLADIDRPLNKRGKGDAPLMGKVLRKAGVEPDLILSSPANRAITTAEVIAKTWHTINYEVVCGIGARVPRVYL